MAKEKIKFNSMVKKLTITNYYDLNGDMIKMDTKTFKNSPVKIIEKQVKVFNTAWKEMNILVNNEIIGYNVISAHGDSNNLSVCVCDDAG